MLLTAILDYAGGTYVFQLRVANVAEAPSRLHEAFDWSALHPSPTPAALRSFLGELAGGQLTSVSGVRGVWCMTGRLGAKLAIFHFVDTSEGNR